MAFGIRRRSPGSENFEVCITNMYGQVRLEDFWSPYSGATREECEEYIERIKAASKEIEADIKARRRAKPATIPTDFWKE